MKASTFLATVLLSTSLYAQDNSSMTSIDMQKKSTKKLTVLADGASFLLKGAGVKATYGLTNNIALGALAQLYKFQPESSVTTNSNFKPKNEVTALGVIADYHVSAIDQAGIYISMAYMNVKAKTTLDASYYGGSTSEDQTSGLQTKVGYQFIGQLASNLNMTFQLGLGYGIGGAIETTGSGSQVSTMSGTQKSAKSTTEIQSSLLLDLSAGMSF